MNAEQLHLIALDLKEVFSESTVSPRLSKLAKQLQNLVNAPQQPQHQTEVQNTRRELVSDLNESDYNNWDVNRAKIAAELGATNLFGKKLAKRIEETFTVNAATPEVIRKDIAEIQKEVQDFYESLDALTSSLGYFEIGFEDLESGDGEIGIIIPRANYESLSDFTKDLRRLDFEMKTLAQVVTGTADDFQIRTISSSDFLVVLASIPDMVNFVSNLIVALRTGYEKSQELKKIMKKLRDLGNSSEDTLSNIEKDVEDAMDKEVKDIIKNIQPMYEAAIQKGLDPAGFEVSIERTIKGLASRIDKGYNFTFRVGPPEAQGEEEPSKEEQKQIENAKNVDSNNNKLRQLKMVKPGQQVLPLEWQTEVEDSDNSES